MKVYNLYNLFILYNLLFIYLILNIKKIKSHIYIFIIDTKSFYIISNNNIINSPLNKIYQSIINYLLRDFFWSIIDKC